METLKVGDIVTLTASRRERTTYPNDLWIGIVTRISGAFTYVAWRNPSCVNEGGWLPSNLQLLKCNLNTLIDISTNIGILEKYVNMLRY